MIALFPPSYFVCVQPARAGIARRLPCPIFEDFVNNEYLPWSKKQHQAHPRTHKRYKVASKPLIAFFGKLPLDAIGSSHVEKFKLARSREISSAGTNRDLAALRFMLNVAMRLDHIARNPVSGVRFLPEDREACESFRTMSSKSI
jgi:hypothetical protein